MKFDGYVIVDAQGAELWRANPDDALPEMAEALRKLTKERGASGLCAARRWCDESGAEVRFEILTPLVRATAIGGDTVSAIQVEVWHAATPPIWLGVTPSQLDPSKYLLIAHLLLPAQDTLDLAYRVTQNTETAWHPRKAQRSTEVGDVFVLKGNDSTQGSAVAVTSFGFQRVQFVARA